jgi:hypothetical protein
MAGSVRGMLMFMFLLVLTAVGREDAILLRWMTWGLAALTVSAT